MTIGQDLSERIAQLEGTRAAVQPRASRIPGFGPTGPWLVTPTSSPIATDLAISCALDGEVLQASRTSLMIYDIPELIARLSAVVPAAARRPHLHRHAVRHRQRPHAQAIPSCG